jgi:hypothetical protein
VELGHLRSHAHDIHISIVVQANILLTGGEDANFFAWSCDPLPREGSGMTTDSDFDSSVSVKRDHDEDIEMEISSPNNVSG